MEEDHRNVNSQRRQEYCLSVADSPFISWNRVVFNPRYTLESPVGFVLLFFLNLSMPGYLALAITQ